MVEVLGLQAQAAILTVMANVLTAFDMMRSHAPVGTAASACKLQQDRTSDTVAAVSLVVAADGRLRNFSDLPKKRLVIGVLQTRFSHLEWGDPMIVGDLRNCRPGLSISRTIASFQRRLGCVAASRQEGSVRSTASYMSDRRLPDLAHFARTDTSALRMSFEGIGDASAAPSNERV
jgi:hypothetical protein